MRSKGHHDRIEPIQGINQFKKLIIIIEVDPSSVTGQRLYSFGFDRLGDQMMAIESTKAYAVTAIDPIGPLFVSLRLDSI